MSTKAYVLIETVAGRNPEVVSALRQLPRVSRVDVVTGPYDIISIIEADSLTEVGAVVTTRMQPIPGVARTVTCLVI